MRRRGVVAQMPTVVGSVKLSSAVMCASGTAGHSTELGSYLDLAKVGAIVIKSLAPWPWDGNPAPRVHQTTAGMINSVGLQGPGVEAWMRTELPELEAVGATVVASIWGRTVADYAAAAEMLADAGPSVVAVEVNVSCPNVEKANAMFAHSPSATEEVLAATESCGRPRWAKLSPNTGELVQVAEAALRGGAEAVTLVNTYMGMSIDVEQRRPVLGAGGGGVSGPGIHALAVRAAYDCARAFPDMPIIGVGGVASGRDAIEFLMAGASAVQVGTASFAEPRAVARIDNEVSEWCGRHGVTDLRELIGAVHDHQR